jgi:hypothetical protein
VNWRSFGEYVESRPLVEQRAIRKARQQYLDSHGYRQVAEDPAYRDYFESFSGYEDPPAGRPESLEARLSRLLDKQDEL